MRSHKPRVQDKLTIRTTKNHIAPKNLNNDNAATLHRTTDM